MKIVNFLLVTMMLSGCTATKSLTSSNAKLKARVYVNKQGQLIYSLKNGKNEIIKPSKMGINIDNVKLGDGVTIKPLKEQFHSDSFAWLGTSSTINNRYIAKNYQVTHIDTEKKWLLETRCYDSGFAFRYVIKNNIGDVNKRKVVAESTTWHLPEDAQLWYHKNGGAFQTYWKKQRASDIKSHYNAQLNVTMELADGSYASLNEAGGFDFSGGSLLFNGTSEASTIYAADKNGWEITGDITSPWRIVMVAKNLNDLVNSNLTIAVCPPPNKKLFPQGAKTTWIKPGRSLWQWWGYWNPGTEWTKQRWFIDNAAALGCQYYLVDEGWEHPAQGWVIEGRTAWQALAELAEYAKKRSVKLLVWRSYPANKNAYYEGLETVAKRTKFFENCKKAGVYGAKIDFLNSEDVVHNKFMHDCLREAAKYQLTINYHGAPKPIGQERTYPNQVSREGVVGMEHNKWEIIPRCHYATVPFTRFLSGYADFTVTTFQEKFVKGTTSTLQLAQAIVYTSPALHWADKPQYYLNSTAVDLIRSVPTTWDETIVLPTSKIGVQAAYARRDGEEWYVGIINGSDDQVQQQLNLSFLGEGSFITTSYSDIAGKSTKIKKSLMNKKNGDKIEINMSPGGGFVAVFRKIEAIPYGGAIYGSQDVTINSVKDAKVYYTLNGSAPTKNSILYNGKIRIKKTCTLRAKIISGDGQGNEISANFCELALPAPEIDDKSLMNKGEKIGMMNLTKGKIYYTTNGSTPTNKSTEYTKPLAITNACTIKAITTYNGMVSKIASKKLVLYPEPAPKAQVKLADLNPLKITTGWGDVQRNKNISGQPLKIIKKTYDNGMGVHANSEMVYKINANYSHFVAGVGIVSGRSGSVNFIVKIDGKVVAKSPVIKSENIWYFNIKIPQGAKNIQLLSLDGGDGKNNDHVNWVDAGFMIK